MDKLFVIVCVYFFAILASSTWASHEDITTCQAQQLIQEILRKLGERTIPYKPDAKPTGWYRSHSVGSKNMHFVYQEKSEWVYKVGSNIFEQSQTVGGLYVANNSFIVSLRGEIRILYADIEKTVYSDYNSDGLVDKVRPAVWGRIPLKDHERDALSKPNHQKDYCTVLKSILGFALK